MKLELTNTEVKAISWLLQATLNVQGASDEQMLDFYQAKLSLREKLVEIPIGKNRIANVAINTKPDGNET